MPQEHTLTVTVEASGEVTPAPQPQDPEALQPPTTEELNDG